MAGYSKTSRDVWNGTVFRGLADDGKLSDFYVRTCPHSNIIGTFVLRLGYMQADLGWAPERVRQSVLELVEKGRIEYDEETSLLRIVDHWQNNTAENPNVAKSIVKVIKTLPRCGVLLNTIKAIIALDNEFLNPYVNELENVFPNEFLNQKQKQEQKPEQEPEQDKDSAPDGAPREHDPLSQIVDDFWNAFPKRRRTQRDNVRAQIARILKANKATGADLIAAAHRYAASDLGPDEQFAKPPLKWLKEEQWTVTYIPAWKAAKSSRAPGSIMNALRSGLAQYADPDDKAVEYAEGATIWAP